MKDNVVLGGSVMAAFAASLCCIGPLVAITAGLGTFGAAAAFEALRPYFIGLTALLLAGAFYLTYRKRAVSCQGEACRVRGTSRTSKILLWFATAAVVAFASFPYYSGALLKAATQENQSVAAESASDIEKTLRVNGMTCGGCSASIEHALKNVDGVVAVKAKHGKEGTVWVKYDGTKVELEKIKQVIRDVGFEVVDQ